MYMSGKIVFISIILILFLTDEFNILARVLIFKHKKRESNVSDEINLIFRNRSKENK